MVSKKKDKSQKTKNTKSNTKVEVIKNKKLCEIVKDRNVLVNLIDNLKGKKNEKTTDREYVKEMGVVEKLLHKDKQKILIKMFLRNGNNTEFYVSPKETFFTFRGGTYLIIQEYNDYDEGAKSSFAFYHEDCCLPFRIKLSIGDFYGCVEDSEDGVNNVSQAMNPKNLSRFQNGTLIEQTMSGSKLEDAQKIQTFIAIANAILLVLVLVIVIYNTGAFN